MMSIQGTTTLTQGMTSVSTATKSGTTKMTQGMTSVSVVTKSGKTKLTQGMTSTSVVTKSVSNVTSVTSSNKTEGKNTKMWKSMLAAAAGGGLIVVFILVMSVCLRAKRRTGVKNEKGLHMRKQPNTTDQSVWMKTIDNS
ncbi:uncharacterized protein LOC105927104, partial [Fundulus heteroclitus]|uniref:uncharacterized protein LOC105927104 n=1 Tax=Fundulus heteroclitus TaxID=8078 RepID=UPI00165CA607